jgi:hypothetical protein
MKELDSVGCYYDPENQIVYPMLKDKKPDLDNGVFLKDCSDEWFEKLSINDCKKIQI